MYLSLNWIKRFLKSDITNTPLELQNLVSTKVAELEGFEDQSKNFDNIVIGKIIKLDKHPNADKLTVCQVEVGLEEPVQIVCGGTNLEENMLTVVALPGSQVRWHGEGDLITLKATKLRGEYSHGMICTSEEIGLGKPEDESHIMNLNHLTQAKPGLNLSQALNLDDVIFEIDNKSITNRPDLWGHIGFAREIAAITNNQLQTPQFELPETKNSTEYQVNISQENICKRFMSIKLSNLTNPNLEIAEKIKSDLEKLGSKSVNPIVDAINHTMLEYGQPMHAYDFQKITKLANQSPIQLNIEFSQKETTFQGIDNNEYNLSSNIPVLTINQTPVCILGIMGGKNTEVDQNTTEILIESANFIDSTVRKASQELALRSESSQRFEKCLDPNQTSQALAKAISLLQEIYPNLTLSETTQDLYPEPQPEVKIDISTQEINSYLGTEISTDQIIQILEKLEFQTKATQDQIEIIVPSFRASKDIAIKQDIIEEVGRIYGYELIPTQLPNQSNQLPRTNISRKLENQIRQTLESLGTHEALNYSFYSQNDIDSTLIDEDHVRVKNYLSEEQTHMRVSLLPGLLKNILQNYKNFPAASFYEIGRTYHTTSDFFPAEEEKLAIAVYNNNNDLNSFLDLKGKVQDLFQKLHLKNYKIQKSESPSPQAHPNINADIIDSKQNKIGEIYLVTPKIIENYNIKETNVFYAELNLGMLLHEKTDTVIFNELPKFPDMTFDISVVVDHQTTHQEILNALSNTSKLIHNIELFDIFEDESKLGANKKALGYQITLRSLDRTLTDEDLNQVQQKSYKKLEQIGGIIRGN